MRVPEPLERELDRLREALEASWDGRTSYRGVTREGNRAYGQCYPTSRVVQHLHPELRIVEGKVWTGAGLEDHFWNALVLDGTVLHVDLTWRQFPPGSSVREFRVRDRRTLGDSDATLARCALLLRRVVAHLAR